MKWRLMRQVSSVLVGSICILLTGSVILKTDTTYANELYVDQNCRKNQRLPQSAQFTVFYASKFMAQGQTYWLYAARYQDGAGILCVVNTSGKPPQLITLSQVKNQFIREEIVKDSERDSVFLVPVGAGNGFRVDKNGRRYTVALDYRLDLSDPSRPVLTFLRERRE